MSNLYSPCASHSWLYKGTWKLVCSLQKQNQKIALNYCFLLMVLIASFYHIKIGYIDVRVYNLSIHILKKLQATVWIATFVWIHGTPWDVKFDITKLRASFKPMSVLCFYSITYTKSLRTTTDIWPWWIPLINETKHPPVINAPPVCGARFYDFKAHKTMQELFDQSYVHKRENFL